MPQKTTCFSVFYLVAVILLLGVVATAVIQKQHESTIGITAAKGFDAQQLIQDAIYWEIVSLVAFVLAILSLPIALWRGEDHRWVGVPFIVLLSLYVMLQLLLV